LDNQNVPYFHFIQEIWPGIEGVYVCVCHHFWQKKNILFTNKTKSSVEHTFSRNSNVEKRNEIVVDFNFFQTLTKLWAMPIPLIDIVRFPYFEGNSNWTLHLCKRRKMEVQSFDILWIHKSSNDGPWARGFVRGKKIHFFLLFSKHFLNHHGYKGITVVPSFDILWIHKSSNGGPWARGFVGNKQHIFFVVSETLLESPWI